MYYKRGQGLSTNAIILIILGVVVLVMLVLGFSLGWNKLNPFLSTDNIQAVVTSCSIACSTSSQFDFCSQKRELKSSEETLKDITCFYLAERKKQYGIQACPGISCNVVLVDEAVVESNIDTTLNTECDKPENKGKTVQALVGETLNSKECPSEE